MPRRKSRRERLAELEAELSSRLKPLLTGVARGANSLFFFTAQHNPLSLPAAELSSECAQLVLLGREAIDLRGALGLDTQACAAALLLASQTRAAGPPQIAAMVLAHQLLSAIASADNSTS